MASSGIRPTYLRCEYRVDPLGIDALRPRLSWELESTKPDERGQIQSAYQIVVTSSGKTVWNSGRRESDEQNQIEYEGEQLKSDEVYSWRVRVWDRANTPSDWSETATWTTGLLGRHWSRRIEEPTNDPEPKWVGPALDTPWSEFHSGPAPLLRRGFDLPAGKIARATIFATALGVYELHLNGKPVGDQVLAPEWTDYHKRLQYQAYDVTPLLTSGANAIGAIVAPGWYAGRVGLSHLANSGARRGIYGRHLRLYLEMRVHFTDGSVHSIRTDDAWRYSMDGPIVASDLLDGETYDSRRQIAGWSATRFDDGQWQKVACNDFGPRLVAQPCEPVRVTQNLPAVTVTESSPGTFNFDLGQNIAGRCRLTMRGLRAGDEVVMRHAEVLDEKGSIYRDNLRIPPVSPLGAPQEDHYIARGDDAGEQFEPRFTFHGFRYVEVKGLRDRPKLEELVGRAMHSSMLNAGEFECSSDLLNRIMRAIVWTQRDNMISVPTDCPQRDERLGWTGDMQVFCGAACFNMDMAAFLGKWLRDIADGQSVDGQMPDFAPHPYDPDTRFSGNPGWGCAAPVVAWKLYSIYGDRRLLEEMFEPCARFVRAIHRENPNLIWRPRTFPFTYGDWLDADTLKLDGWPTKGGEVPKDLYATAFFAHDADLVARMARVLGRDSESREFETLARKIRDQFNQEFVSTDATIKGDTQAGYALALAFDLLPENQRERAAGHMVDALKPYGGALSTGFQSTLRMMLALTRFGHHKQAYALITRREMPSWGYMVEHGGTTIWERWDGFVEGRGFQNAGMNSFCHYAIGAVGEWMYRVIGGINPDESQPGFKRLIIRPIPGGGLTWAKCAYRSIRGRIATHWQVDPATGKFSLDLTIPPNMSAVVDVPGASPVEVGSGSHGFQSQLDRSGR